MGLVLGCSRFKVDSHVSTGRGIRFVTTFNFARLIVLGFHSQTSSYYYCYSSFKSSHVFKILIGVRFWLHSFRANISPQSMRVCLYVAQHSTNMWLPIKACAIIRSMSTKASRQPDAPQCVILGCRAKITKAPAMSSFSAMAAALAARLE